MLTHNDYTVADAEEIFEQCKDTATECWGFKEKPLPMSRMKSLFSKMKDSGKTTFLEVVAYDEKRGLDGATIAAECGCDYLMGTKFHDSIAEFCDSHSIRYLPFAGTVTGRPSVLTGTIDEIVEEARALVSKGAYGVDLLGYRFTGDAATLNRTLIEELKAPVCLAGSIESYKRLEEVKRFAPAFFTIGSAFFENKFDGSFREQIEKVCDFIHS